MSISCFLDPYVSIFGTVRQRLVLPAVGLALQVLLLTVITLSLHAQTEAVFSGTVRDSQGGAVRGASVRLQGPDAVEREAMTGEDGSFFIRGINSGRYQLQVQRSGFEPLRQELDWRSRGSSPLELVIRAGTLRQAITVSADVSEGYLQPETQIATRSLTPLRDLPQAVTVITRETLDDQQAFRFTDLYRNASGVNAFSHYNDFTARGFRSGDGNVMINGQQGSGFNWHVPMTLSPELCTAMSPRLRAETR